MPLGKHFIQDVAAPGEKLPEGYKSPVERALKCMVDINPTLRLIESHKVVYNWPTKTDQVALISGGGSGHEPAHVGFVGNGMLDVAVAGDVFASPSTAQILVGLRTVESSKGTLMIVKNYTGDMLNFGAAAQKRRAEGHDVSVVIVNEDASLDGGSMVGRRGLAGTIFVHKIAGAAAARGNTLDDVTRTAQKVVDSMATVGVSLDRCSVPGRSGQEGLKSGEIEFGMGIHNEPGVLRADIGSLASTVTKVLEYLFSPTSPFPAPPTSDVSIPVAVLINNLGGLSSLELHVIAHEVLRQLSDKSPTLTVVRKYVGTFMTSLDGPGFSVTILKLDDELLPLLDDPTAAPSWPKPLPTDALPTSSRISKITDTASQKPPFETPSSQVATLPSETWTSLTTALQSRIRSSEPQITKLDTILGDGDCGTTLLKAATAVHESFQASPESSPPHIAAALWQTAEAVSDSMGGTSGALYSIFLHSLAANLRHASQTESLRAQIAKALRGSLDDLYKFTLARTGDRTLMDALIPFVNTFEQTGGDMAAAVSAAREGCEATKRMEAKAGRASYAKSEHAAGESGVMDPGALGLLCILEVLEEQFK
ncbi:hypothetical protein TWF696_004014 [Orbilia brochopaga]|uniref:Dihydroxyacetone kinase n=1 Tax=Orbilia brochopaga TaxID=3140254 RepID=A0AAV9V8K3_9PEZI